LLNYYKKEWDRFTTAMKYIHNIFEYLVRLIFSSQDLPNVRSCYSGPLCLIFAYEILPSCAPVLRLVSLTRISVAFLRPLEPPLDQARIRRWWKERRLSHLYSTLSILQAILFDFFSLQFVHRHSGSSNNDICICHSSFYFLDVSNVLSIVHGLRFCYPAP
jgi:hypothetical protein